MRIQSTLTLFATLAAAAASASAQTTTDLTIDDFSTGQYQSPHYYYGQSHDIVVYGSMLGFSRDTNMNVCAGTTPCPASNPYNQPSSYGFFPATATTKPAFVQTAGYGTGPRIDMGYGFHGAMHENLTQFQKIRLNFKGLSQPLNFNILLYSGGGSYYAIGGCNLAPLNRDFAIELPLNLFSAGKGFSFSDVSYMDFIFQDGSVIGNVGFAITSIELTNNTKPGTTIPCHY